MSNKQFYSEHSEIYFNLYNPPFCGQLLRICISEYEQKCRDILEDAEIRYAGLLDEFGTLLAGGHKAGISLSLNFQTGSPFCVNSVKWV